MKVLEKIEMLLNESGQAEYQKFFKKKLADYGVDSVDDLSEDEKKKFFDEIKKEWKK